MSLSGLLPAVETTPEYQRLMDAFRRADPPVAVAPNAGKPWLVSALRRDLRVPILLLSPRPESARRLVDQLQAILGDDAPVYHFPEREALPYERLVPDTATTRQRLQALHELAQDGPDPSPPVVVASLAAAMQKTLARETFESAVHVVQSGDIVRLEELISRCQQLGYEVEPTVETPGTISRRGGILDIFVPGDELPVRIELWGDQVDSLRRFDPATQRSVETLRSVTVVPCAEILPSLVDDTAIEALTRQLDFSTCSPGEQTRIHDELLRLSRGHGVEELPFYAGFFCTGTLLDYLPDHALVITDEPSQLQEAAYEMDERTRQLRSAKESRGELPRGFPPSAVGWDELSNSVAMHPRRMAVAQWQPSEGEAVLLFPFSRPSSYSGRTDRLCRDITEALQMDTASVIVSYHDQRLEEILADARIPVRRAASLDEPPEPGVATVVHGYLAEGWDLRENGDRVLLLTDSEVFGTAKMRRPAPRRRSTPQTTLADLVPGTFVVHIDHGIARFEGTTWQADSEGSEREYLVLVYAEGDRLYVPTEHLDRISPYTSSGDAAPTLTRLGTQEWQRTKRRVKESTREMARELLTLYASRESTQGIAFPTDSPWERELEDSFPYVETADQALAVSEVKQDMQDLTPMDRLVCGDVGYGKTEVALRATFKAVMHGMQVAILVPTTVLAQQHYATFAQRLSPYPVHVEVLSRFRTREEQRQIVEDLQAGKVDICIGTHRLLQKDVGFRNLGLVIVDEEHRFGVRHKERLKQMRREVDVLTLTATPIPRTLYMALSSVRNMSSMETPPEERLPVKTYASEYSEDLVREAILRELDRGGQVYFVHNRVHGLHRIGSSLQELVPEARVGVAHGRMPEDQLAAVMDEFAGANLDVLVCTTIIESGLDIPNVNTMIMNRADMLGLAQLYQLRGRIGRSAQRAYCYLLVPRGKQLTEASEKRIKTILAATELGSGFRIAMTDLEIRGAGNLLGQEQSGHIQAVGFDLYTRLVAEAVEELRSGGEIQSQDAEGLLSLEETPASAAQPRVDLPLPASIPETYVEHLPTRLSLYRRLMAVNDRREIKTLEEEIRDRFGPPPDEVQHLLYLVQVRLLGGRAGVDSVTQEGDFIALRLSEPVGGARPALEKALQGLAEVGNTRIRVPWHRQPRVWQDRVIATLERLAGFQARLQEQLAAAAQE